MNKPANTYHQLIDSINQLLQQGRQQAAIAVNYHIVHTYWEIGRYIVEYEQKGELKQEYGTKLIDILSTDLSNKFGKGFSRSNLFNFRKFYLLFEKVQTPSGQLIISKPFEKIQTVSGQFQKSGTLSHQLKLGEVSYQDVGQMNLYLNYFEKEENVEGENQPVGIILSALKDDILVEYALGNISSQMFVSTYQLYLPDKKLLKEKLQILLDK